MKRSPFSRRLRGHFLSIKRENIQRTPLTFGHIELYINTTYYSNSLRLAEWFKGYSICFNLIISADKTMLILRTRNQIMEELCFVQEGFISNERFLLNILYHLTRGWFRKFNNVASRLINIKTYISCDIVIVRLFVSCIFGRDEIANVPYEN